MKPLINIHIFLLLLFALVLSGCQTTAMTKEDQDLAYRFQPDKEKATVYVINPVQGFKLSALIRFGVPSVQADDAGAILSNDFIVPQSTFSRVLLDEGAYYVRATHSKESLADLHKRGFKTLNVNLSKGQVYYFLISAQSGVTILSKAVVFNQITKAEAKSIIERKNLQPVVSSSRTLRATSLNFD